MAIQYAAPFFRAVRSFAPGTFTPAGMLFIAQRRLRRGRLELVTFGHSNTAFFEHVTRRGARTNLAATPGTSAHDTSRYRSGKKRVKRSGRRTRRGSTKANGQGARKVTAGSVPDGRLRNLSWESPLARPAGVAR